MTGLVGIKRILPYDRMRIGVIRIIAIDEDVAVSAMCVQMIVWSGIRVALEYINITEMGISDT